MEESVLYVVYETQLLINIFFNMIVCRTLYTL